MRHTAPIGRCGQRPATHFGRFKINAEHFCGSPYPFTPRSWSHCHFLINRQSIDDRVDRADREITIGCLFHGACWGAIALPDSGKKNGMFQVGPLAVEIVLDLHGSHENFQSRWTITIVGREYLVVVRHTTSRLGTSKLVKSFILQGQLPFGFHIHPSPFLLHPLASMAVEGVYYFL